MRYLSPFEVWVIHLFIVIVDESKHDRLSPDVLNTFARREAMRVKHGLLDSAVFAAQVPYLKNVWKRAAVLIRSLIQNHPFFDGNKRTGLLAVVAFLELNGYKLVATQKQKVRFARSIALGRELWGIESWLRRYARPAEEAVTERTVAAIGAIEAMRKAWQTIGMSRIFPDTWLQGDD